MADHLRTKKGRRVMFVARPELMSPSNVFEFARPDDVSDTGETWREKLINYNAQQKQNQLHLSPASDLYTHPTYARLAKKVRSENLFILSAGWGMLPANFLTPNYDITFSAQAEPYKKRRRGDEYSDFVLPARGQEEPIVFFGGKDYVPLFAELTRSHKGPRTVYYNSQNAPAAPGCRLERFQTTTRTNWHYESADAWLSRLAE
ncbi:MAG: hypothetical protein OJI70_16705 [Zavarzinia sp.]|nr:hypothetical protein [Zavarzinia sp.]